MNMSTLNEKPRVILKSKSIQAVFDYCLEQKIEFSVLPRTFGNDEFEVEFNIKEIKKAIVFGMFLRENKLELLGMEEFSKTKPAPKPLVAKKTEPKNASESKNTENTNKEDNSLMFNAEPNANDNPLGL